MSVSCIRLRYCNNNSIKGHCSHSMTRQFKKFKFTVALRNNNNMILIKRCSLTTVKLTALYRHAHTNLRSPTQIQKFINNQYWFLDLSCSLPPPSSSPSLFMCFYLYPTATHRHTTQTLGTIRDEDPRTSTSIFTQQLVSSEKTRLDVGSFLIVLQLFQVDTCLWRLTDACLAFSVSRFGLAVRR